MPIETLAVGDTVVAVDQHGRTLPVRIHDLFNRFSPITVVETAAGPLRTTSEHPLWMGGTIFRPVSKLQPGDQVMRCSDGVITPTGVLSIHQEKGDGEQVFNMHVDAPNTYVAGGFVVHNKTGTGSDSDSQLFKVASVSPGSGGGGNGTWLHEDKNILLAFTLPPSPSPPPPPSQ